MRLLNATTKLADPYKQFGELEPMLQAIYFDAANYAYTRFRKSLLITSMYRPDDPGVHGYHRGLNFDVCEGFVYEGGIMPIEAELLADYINRKYRYNPSNNFNVLVYGLRDPAGGHWNHVHLQVCNRTEKTLDK